MSLEVIEHTIPTEERDRALGRELFVSKQHIAKGAEEDALLSLLNLGAFFSAPEADDSIWGGQAVKPFVIVSEDDAREEVPREATAVVREGISPEQISVNDFMVQRLRPGRDWTRAHKAIFWELYADVCAKRESTAFASTAFDAYLEAQALLEDDDLPRLLRAVGNVLVLSSFDASFEKQNLDEAAFNRAIDAQRRIVENGDKIAPEVDYVFTVQACHWMAKSKKKLVFLLPLALRGLQTAHNVPKGFSFSKFLGETRYAGFEEPTAFNLESEAPHLGYLYELIAECLLANPTCIADMDPAYQPLLDRHFGSRDAVTLLKVAAKRALDLSTHLVAPPRTSAPRVIRKFSVDRTKNWLLLAQVEIEEGNREGAIELVLTADSEARKDPTDPCRAYTSLKEAYEFDEEWQVLAPMLLPKLAESRLIAAPQIAGAVLDRYMVKIDELVEDLRELGCDGAADHVVTRVRAIRGSYFFTAHRCHAALAGESKGDGASLLALGILGLGVVAPNTMPPYFAEFFRAISRGVREEGALDQLDESQRGFLARAFGSIDPVQIAERAIQQALTIAGSRGSNPDFQGWNGKKDAKQGSYLVDLARGFIEDGKTDDALRVLRQAKLDGATDRDIEDAVERGFATFASRTATKFKVTLLGDRPSSVRFN